MPGIGTMQVNLTSDVGGLLKGISDSVSKLKGLEKAGQQVADHTSRITAGMGKAWSLVKVAIASVVAGATIHSLNEASETVDKLGKASARLGIGVEQLSALRFAAAEADVDFDSLSKMIGKAAKSIGELSRTQDTIFVGNVQVRIKDTEAHVRSMAELLPELAVGLESVGSQAEQLNLASKFFGKEGGAQFVQLLKESGGFVQNLAIQSERARRLGVVFTNDQVEKLTAYNDAVGRISEAWLGLRVNIITKIAPTLTDLANKAASAIASVPEIAAKVVDVMGKAWSDPKIQEKFIAFTESLGTIWYTAMQGQMIIAGALVADLLGKVLPAIGKPLLLKLGKDYARWFLDGFASNIEAVASLGDPNGMIPSMLNSWASSMRITGSKIGADTGQDMVAAISEQLSGRTWTAEAASEVFGNISNAFEQAAAQGEDLFGIGAILRSHSMDLNSLFSPKPDKQDPLSDWQLRVRKFAQDASIEIENFSRTWSDATVEWAIDGKNTFAEISKNFGKMLLSMALNTLFYAPIFKALGSGFATALGVPDAQGGTNVQANALGNVFKSGRVVPFANGGIVRRPIVFPMAKGMGLMGEAGPEAIMPLTRIGGKLGVKASGGGTTVQIIDQRSGGAPVEVRESAGPDGRKLVQAFVRDEVAKMAKDGSLDRALGVYGVQRKPVPR